MTPDTHRSRHVLLHRMLDELVADWIGETEGLPSNASVMDLINWSHSQTITPTPVAKQHARKTLTLRSVRPDRGDAP